MTSALYTLLFDGHELGTVAEDDFEFPTFFGRFELATDSNGESELGHVLEYVEYSIKTWPLIMEDRLHEMDWEVEEPLRT